MEALNTSETGIELPEPKGVLSLENLFFAYPGAEKPVIKNVSFAVQPGELLRMIGLTASGKSTSASLLGGTLALRGGHVRLDSMELSQWESSDRGRYVGFLPQDGDVVMAGQTLIRLDDTQARVTLERLKGRTIVSHALEARLIAERDSEDRSAFPESLTADDGDKANALTLVGQLKIFTTHGEAVIVQESILKQQSAQLNEEISGLRGLIAAENTQIELIRSENSDVQTLDTKGMAKHPRLLALKRQQAEIEGASSRNIAAVARAKQQIAETRLRISKLKPQKLNQVVEELRGTQTELFDLEGRIRSAKDVLARTLIVVPLDGTIVGLQIHTPGGVIGPGEDFVPSGAGMLSNPKSIRRTSMSRMPAFLRRSG